MAPATFGPKGTVFSSTVLRIPVPGRTPPFTLAYVDVDDGPRILAHVDGSDEVLVPGSRVALAGWSEHGDPVVQRTGP
ncbi:MAG: OB-fold domain-containing protein [bacterium]|nr:OB-fold domain-containing protein [bacterium]